MDAPLTQMLLKAYQHIFGKSAAEFDYWDFTTNRYTTSMLGFPTIGFGPGEYKLANMVDERNRVEQITVAC